MGDLVLHCESHVSQWSLNMIMLTTMHTGSEIITISPNAIEQHCKNKQLFRPQIIVVNKLNSSQAIPSVFLFEHQLLSLFSHPKNIAPLVKKPQVSLSRQTAKQCHPKTKIKNKKIKKREIKKKSEKVTWERVKELSNTVMDLSIWRKVYLTKQGEDILRTKKKAFKNVLYNVKPF